MVRQERWLRWDEGPGQREIKAIPVGCVSFWHPGPLISFIKNRTGTENAESLFALSYPGASQYQADEWENA